MISKTTLQQAAQQHIIEDVQVEPLYQFIQQQQDATSSVSREEPLKFVRSFGDVFIALGIVLLLMAFNMLDISGYYYFLPVAGFVVMAEWLVRVKRLALPGLVILLAILFFTNKAIAFDYENATFFSIGVFSLSSLLFYLRYKMPFSLLPLAAGLVAMIIIQLGINTIEHPIVFVILGLLVFSVAMWFDSQDTRRLTHMSDSAFWLHLLAAPLIVHGTMVFMLLNDQVLQHIISQEWLIMLFFIGFFLLALLVDRRAMLISTQLYVIYALTQLLHDKLDSSQNLMIYVFFILGLFVIFSGTYWYKVRTLIFGFLTGSVISSYIPDLMMEDVTSRD